MTNERPHTTARGLGCFSLVLSGRRVCGESLSVQTAGSQAHAERTHALVFRTRRVRRRAELVHVHGPVNWSPLKALRMVAELGAPEGDALGACDDDVLEATEGHAVGMALRWVHAKAIATPSESDGDVLGATEGEALGACDGIMLGGREGNVHSARVSATVT